MMETKTIKIILIIAVAFILSLIIRRVVNLIVRQILQRENKMRHHEASKRAQTLASAIGTMIIILVWVVALMLSLNALGLNLEALLTSAGLIGVVVSFGAQNTIRDVLAGILIVAENQFRVGDVIKYYYAGEQISGTVEEITLRVTKIRDLDGNLHIIRNGFSEVITNRTFKYANASIEIIVDYKTDLDKLEEVINRVGEEMIIDPTWREKIIKPVSFVRVASFEPNGIRVKALGRVEAAEQWKVSGEFLRRAKKAFEQNHIHIAINQVMLHQTNKD